MKEQIIVGAFEGRLDRYLKIIFPHITQGLIQKYIKNKDILLNSKKVEANIYIKKGDEISFYHILNQYKESEKKFDEKKENPAIKSLAAKIMGEYLLYDSEYLMAINKPYELATQGGSKINLSINDALNYINRDNESSVDDLKLVHRIDKATSGVLIIAKGQINASKLMNAFKERLAYKEYIAYLSKAFTPSSGIIDNFLAEHLDSEGHRIVKNYNEPLSESELKFKNAITKFEILEQTQYPLVRFKPITGRMHQIRAHSVLLGAPIVGDKKYGGESFSRLMLHADKITIDEQIFGEKIVIKAHDDKYFEELKTNLINQ